MPGPGELVALLDQEPVVAALLPRATAHAHESPAALEVLAMKDELELSLGVALAGVPLRLPGPVVPDHDGAAAVLTGGNGTLEGAVVERMVLDVDGEAPVGGIEAWSSRYRPALEDAGQLQPEIVVQATCRVLLDHEAVARALVGHVSRRLGSPVEPPLSLIGGEIFNSLGSARCLGQTELDSRLVYPTRWARTL